MQQRHNPGHINDKKQRQFSRSVCLPAPAKSLIKADPTERLNRKCTLIQGLDDNLQQRTEIN